MQDEEIIDGLKNNNGRRGHFENEFYQRYNYFIKEGRKKYNLSHDDSFTAYSDALLSAIHNIINGRYNNQYKLKTYLFKIFLNKCVDLIRKNTNNKEKPNQSPVTPELLHYIPDDVRNALEKQIDQEKVSVIMKYFDVMDEKCKSILRLHVDEYSDKEIAEKLGYNNAAVVKTTRLRCREKLKNLITNHE